MLVETHGALRDAWEIAALPGVQVLDFGLMDFVSGHHGAIHASNMRSPGQFEHPLVARAKAEVVAAALAHGVVPAHNVTLDLKNAYNVFRDAWRARNEFGFLRMWSIYPVADPADRRRDEARPGRGRRRRPRSCSRRSSANWGPIQYEGELHDRATYRYFWELLQKARITGVTMPEDAADGLLRLTPERTESE